MTMPMEYSTGNRQYEPSEDISHERVPDHDKGGKYSGAKKKPLSTPPYVSPIGATTEDILVVNHNLWSLQDSKNIRNQRMLLEDPIPFENGTNVNQTSTESATETSTTTRKADPGNLKFEWFIGQWSNCSPPCSGTGFQIRAAHCMVRSDNMTDIVENQLCEDAGLPMPLTVQKCETKECPHWIVHEWQDCNTSRCFAWNTAMQKRDVMCQSTNGTLVPDAWCEASEKPTNKQECYNDLCKGTWKVGEWTDCYPPCDKEGVKYRILQCVWYGTRKPAGTACRDQPKPAVMRPCRGPPCSEVDICKDLSKYCRNVKTSNMCKLPRYQIQCCKSCKDSKV